MQQTAYARMVYERHSRRRAESSGPKAAVSLKNAMKEACRRLIAFLFSQVGVCALLVTYNIIGAFAFRAIEGVAGDALPEETAEEAREQMVGRLWNITLNLNILDQERWRDEVTETINVYIATVVPLIRNHGYRGIRPLDAWSFPAALMYSLSVYTTIGYGNLTPRTEWGKVTTIFYAIVGMPLMLLYMSNVGEILANVFKFLYFKACRCDIGSLGYYRTASGSIRPVTSHHSLSVRQSTENSTHHNHKELNGKLPQMHEETHYEKQTIPITWCLLVIATYVVCGGLLFSQWEGWPLLDGCYFCYISLSTIGFGDMVPGRTVAGDDRGEIETKQVLCSLYLLVGMALVAMCFNLMQEEAIENLKAFWRNLGCMRSKQQPQTARNRAPRPSQPDIMLVVTSRTDESTTSENR